VYIVLSFANLNIPRVGFHPQAARHNITYLLSAVQIQIIMGKMLLHSDKYSFRSSDVC